MWGATLAVGVLLAIGFAAGYVVREIISRRRRAKDREQLRHQKKIEEGF
ncbi:MAG TPA: hypothetical protein VFB45_10265 [Pseudolabrys sp.]|nr:hypothetical protein [Pseudolabrys sp.]